MGVKKYAARPYILRLHCDVCGREMMHDEARNKKNNWGNIIGDFHYICPEGHLAQHKDSFPTWRVEQINEKQQQRTD